MGQSLLIDMNSNWHKHKMEFDDGLRTRNYDQVEGALDNLNALLPEKYKITMDDEEYNTAISNSLTVLCNHCTEEIEDPANDKKTLTVPLAVDFNKIKIQHLLLNRFDQMAYDKKYDDFWDCPRCQNRQRLADTKFKERKLHKPYYLQIVAEPPRRHIGIEDRNKYYSKFGRWARNFLKELNASAQRFREEYKPKEWEKPLLQNLDFGGQEF